MSWVVPSQEHKVFQRNPLVAVIVEVRFHPILKLIDRIPDIQEQVRSGFPAYQDVTRQVVNLQAVSAIDVQQERLFNFLKHDGSSTLSVSKSSLALESRRHESREEFINEAKVGIAALNRVCGPVVVTRLGLRYVNIIDKERIEEDLGRTTTWQKVIAEPFLAVPAGLASLDGTLFSCEVGSPMPAGGGQTVRYGLLQHSDKKLKYRLDVDRYIEDVGESAKIVGHLAAFADDIFAVFVAAMGPDLKAWMPERTT